MVDLRDEIYWNKYHLLKKIVPVQASFSYILVFFLMTQLEIDKSYAWDSNLGRQDGRRQQIH